MLAMPPEVLEEPGLTADTEVSASTSDGKVVIQRAMSAPPDDLIEFAHRFTAKYEEALRNLPQR